MKIILTGSTGFIGTAVLTHCLSHPAITSVLALTRRPLPLTHPKLTPILHADFTTYPPALLAQLQGAAACIWALGAPTAGREVHLACTLAAANAFATHLAPLLAGNSDGGGERPRFHFVQVSGGFVSRDQDASLYFLSEKRKMRGELETRLASFNDEYPETWRTTVARPLGVTGDALVWKALPGGWFIPVEELAAGLVDLAINGEGEVFMENGALRRRGQEALAALG
ncbi:hypothetical protein LTR08_001731 [Meristemomyces frigidus]|nr:hypothetical protein LTR08_001731 [Meristemomyces frigidus]